MKANYRSWVQLMIAIVTNSERSERYKQRAKRCSSKSVIHFRVRVTVYFAETTSSQTKAR